MNLCVLWMLIAKLCFIDAQKRQAFLRSFEKAIFFIHVYSVSYYFECVQTVFWSCWVVIFCSFLLLSLHFCFFLTTVYTLESLSLFSCRGYFCSQHAFSSCTRWMNESTNECLLKCKFAQNTWAFPVWWVCLKFVRNSFCNRFCVKKRTKVEKKQLGERAEKIGAKKRKTFCLQRTLKRSTNKLG